MLPVRADARQAPESADRRDPVPKAEPAPPPGLDMRLPAEALSAALQSMQERFQEAQERAAAAPGRGAGRESQSWADIEYERGRQAIERAQWAIAVQRFTALARARGDRADAAMYWRAYALDKMNRGADALTTVADLAKTYPSSRWLSDARALELQVRQRSGQTVAVQATADEELKLLVIQGLQQTAPERAVPLLAKVLSDSSSLRLKERVLFVLAQSASPEARATLSEVAKGTSHPELQMKAVQYIGMSGRPENLALLGTLYAAATDLDVKRQVLRAFTMAGDRQHVIAVATTEKAPELRTEAVSQLGMMGARDELWQMYQKEQVIDVKRGILTALGMSGATPRLVEIANGEPNLELRVTAVRQLGTMGGPPASGVLVSLYTRNQEPQVRRAAIDGLFLQGNADALVSLARGENNPALRRELVQKLSLMGSPAALEYLTELLNK
jgi:HEAT repeat protein